MIASAVSSKKSLKIRAFKKYKIALAMTIFITFFLNTLIDFDF